MHEVKQAVTMLSGAGRPAQALPVPPPVSTRPRRVQKLYFDRELSWLDFNARVLEEARNPQNPLLERVNFLSIFSRNLDEFFMIHVPGMRERTDDQSGQQMTGREIANRLRVIHAKLQHMLARSYRCLQDILPQLERHGVRVVRHADLDPVEQEWLREYFDREVFPVLTPLSVDPGHPFPYISNLSLSVAVAVRNPRTGQRRFARVKVPGPPAVPRLVPVGNGNTFVLMEEIVCANVDRLFTGMEVLACYPFRVTRDSDLELHEEAAKDLLEMIQQELPKRRFGDLERLEIARDMPDGLRRTVIEELEATEDQVYLVDGPLALGDFSALADLDVPELRYPPFVPGLPARLKGTSDLFAAIRQSDLVLHHPYHSFSVVTDFLEQAAEDPDVLAIKHTLYRTSGDSPVLESLMHAADNGKQVACVVELKARFDEANNITWAKQLESSGVHVVYGLLGLKAHCKVTLVVRREGDSLVRYVHVGTGNYNPRTAVLYTDVGLLTCNPDFGADATDLFNFMTGYSRPERFRKFLVAPVAMRKDLLALVERETESHTEQSPGRIIAKMNALVDPLLIKALYASSQRGVEIDLIVRGMCCLRPGVPGLSERIRVMSVVGRFLEHSRVFYFQNAGRPEVYIGSADWMPRNLDRRVEVMVPVDSPDLNSYLRDTVLETMLKDNCQAWDLQSNGRYVRRRASPGQRRHSAQMELMEAPSGQG